MKKALYKNKFDQQRRQFLKTVTAAGVSHGLLSSFGMAGAMMMARAAEAQNGGPSKSLMLYVAGGAIPELYIPSGGQPKAKSMGYQQHGVMNDIAFLSNTTIDKPGHGQMFARYTNDFSGTSFDINLGKTIGSNYPLPYFNLGVESDGNASPTRENNNAVALINDPRAAFSRLTSALGSGGGSPPPSSGGGVNPKQFYVDRHKEAIQALFGKLGQHEREKLESHLNSIEEIEATLEPSGSNPDNGDSNPVAQACGSLNMPQASGSGFDATAQVQIDIALLALSCNLSASVSLAFGDDDNTFFVPGYNAPLHDSHHSCQGTSCYITTASYMFGLAAQTVARAKANGVLNDTIITQVSEMGHGDLHAGTDVPMFVAGGGGAIRTGQVLNVNEATQMEMYETVARVLGADQHSSYVPMSSTTLSGLI